MNYKYYLKINIYKKLKFQFVLLDSFYWILILLLAPKSCSFSLRLSFFVLDYYFDAYYFVTISSVRPFVSRIKKYI